jgi:hypothetical protein
VPRKDYFELAENALREGGAGAAAAVAYGLLALASQTGDIAAAVDSLEDATRQLSTEVGGVAIAQAAA